MDTLNVGLWVVSILVYIIYNLYQKNKKLEELVQQRDFLLQQFDQIISESDRVLKEFDREGIYRTDDTTGTYFKMISDIQKGLNQFFRK